MTVTLKVDDVDFVKELYPRLRPDEAAIERYRLSLDTLPPIAVARGRVLVDGFHRWQAHLREGIEKIVADDLGDLTDAEIFNESIRRNAKHGQQLSRDDKADVAAKLWQTYAHLKEPERKAEIVELLAVSEKSVERWTKDARTAEKNALKARAWDLWLDCHTQRAIGEMLDTPQKTIDDWLSEKRQLSEIAQPPESLQHFDIWQFTDSGDSSYFGKMPPGVVENLLWTYTKPGDIVADPFAGSGTTITVAKDMGRRVWASDLQGDRWKKTLPIHTYDIAAYAAIARWPDNAPNKVDFVLLDPPYWRQAQGRYSDDPADLGNLGTLDEFNAAWDMVIKNCHGQIAAGGHLAFIVSPTQLDDGTVVDHAFDMIAACESYGLTLERRIIVPYSTQQATGQQVEWARANKRLLKLYRDLVVMA